jgi:hypothetical protein
VAASLLGLVLLLIAGVAVVGGWRFRSSSSSNSDWLVPVAFVVSGFFLICSVGVPLGILRESSLQDREQSKCKEDCDELNAALANIENATLRGLAQANFKQMRIFTLIAQQQARMSYYASLAAATLSLFVLLTGAAAANGLTGTPAKITAGTLAAAGAALSGFLAKTFLSSYAMASRQMSYYYGQPLVHCYLLHAEWLTLTAGESYGKEQEFQLLRQIIEASLDASASAQNHLLDLQEASPDEHARATATAAPALASNKNSNKNNRRANGRAATAGHAKP